MNLITAICDRGIVLDQGSVQFDGSAADAVLHYLPGGKKGAAFDVSSAGLRIGDDRAVLQKAWVESRAGRPQVVFDLREPIVVKMQFEVLRDDVPWPYANYHVLDERGNYVFVTASQERPFGFASSQQGVYVAECEIPPHFLNTGMFTIGVALTCVDRGIHVCFLERDALTIQIVEDLDETLMTSRNGYAGAMPGPMRPQLPWKIAKCIHRS